jgi:uncharacterized protein (TIGR02300 family)
LAKIDRGTKREDPDTGKKFYDLNKDPIVSPYTGKTYPRSFFDQVAVRSKTVADRREQVDEEEEEVVVTEAVETEPGSPEIVSLEEAEAEEGAEGDDIPDVEDVEDIGEDDADVFLEEDEDEDEDLDFEVDSSDER